MFSKLKTLSGLEEKVKNEIYRLIHSIKRWDFKS